MTNDEAAARATLAADAAHQQSHLCHDCSDLLDDAANAVFALIDAGKFKAAEQATHKLLARFPSVHDGYECLRRLYQAKGDNRHAAQMLSAGHRVRPQRAAPL